MSNSQYYELPELIPDEIIERVKKLSPAQLCDGMAPPGIGRDGCMDADLLPLDDGKLTVGAACTVNTKDGDSFPIHVAVYQGKSGYVLVVAGKSYTEHAYTGDLMSGAAVTIGLSGIVIGGYVRDKTGLTAPDIPTYTRGSMQKSPDKKDPGEVNTVVTCAGARVIPGDLVIGDYNGVTVVPRRRIEEVLTATEKKEDYELKCRDAVANYRKCREEGRGLPNLTPVWATEILQGRS